jgi:hypothetical protein
VTTQLDRLSSNEMKIAPSVARQSGWESSDNQDGFAAVAAGE